MSTLQETLNQIINQSKEKICILVVDMMTQERIYEHQSQQKLISASTIKIPIMLTVLNEIAQNNLSLEDPILVRKDQILEDTQVFEFGEREYSIYELLMWMIISSDNTATNVLIEKCGMNTINHYCQEVLETKHTSLQRYMLDSEAVQNGYNNYTCQHDLYMMFVKLMNHDILTDQLCDVAFKILFNQRCQNQVMRYIYEPVLYAHKTGELDYLHHDSGIMLIHQKWYYIGVSIQSDQIEGNYPLIGKIGKTIYDALKEL